MKLERTYRSQKSLLDDITNLEEFYSTTWEERVKTGKLQEGLLVVPLKSLFHSIRKSYPYSIIVSTDAGAYTILCGEPYGGDKGAREGAATANTVKQEFKSEFPTYMFYFITKQGTRYQVYSGANASSVDRFCSR